MDDELFDLIVGDADDGMPPALAAYVRRQRKIGAAALPWVMNGKGVPLLFAVADRLTPESQNKMPLDARRSHHETIHEWLAEAKGLGMDYAPGIDDTDLWTKIIDAATSTEAESMGSLEWVSDVELDNAANKANEIVNKWRIARLQLG